MAVVEQLPSMVVVVCAHCGAEFKRVRGHYLRNERLGRPHFCDLSCRSSATNAARERHAQVPLVCAKCGKSFTRYRAEVRKNLTGKHYCCRECYSLDHGSVTYKRIGDRHEHRIVAEQMIGRPLVEGEVVHHIDGDKRNNHPSNLQVMPKDEHTRMHSLAYHARRRAGLT